MADIELQDTTAPVGAVPVASPAGRLPPIRVEGKFFFAGEDKVFLKGVTYGPFPVGADGTQFPTSERAHQDFALMAKAGINTVRVFTVPPVRLLDIAAEHGLRVLAGIPWSQHITFLDSETVKAEIRRTIMAGVRSLQRHPALLAYMIGNEIPPDMIRWHGADKVRDFLASLVADPTRAADLLGWRPVCSDLETIIRTAWTWHLRTPEAALAVGD